MYPPPGSPIAFGKLYHVTGEEWLTWDRYFELIAGALGMPLPRLVHIPCETAVHRWHPDRLADVIENYRFNNIFDNQAARQRPGFPIYHSIFGWSGETIAWLDEHKRIKDSDLEPLDDAVIAAWDRCQAKVSLSLM